MIPLSLLLEIRIFPWHLGRPTWLPFKRVESRIPDLGQECSKIQAVSFSKWWHKHYVFCLYDPQNLYHQLRKLEEWTDHKVTLLLIFTFSKVFSCDSQLWGQQYRYCCPFYNRWETSSQKLMTAIGSHSELEPRPMISPAFFWYRTVNFPLMGLNRC